MLISETNIFFITFVIGTSYLKKIKYQNLK